MRSQRRSPPRRVRVDGDVSRPLLAPDGHFSSGSTAHSTAEDFQTVQMGADAPHSAEWSILNIQHLLSQRSGNVGGDVQAEGFKSGIVQWSGAYYVAYALMMTIAFAMLAIVPEPRTLPSGSGGALLHWRPASESFDAVVQFVYVVCVCWACYDSTWGMMLCAEWGVRSGAVPPALYERFIHHLDPSLPGRTELYSQRRTQWNWRLCEPRAAHQPNRVFGCICSCFGGRTGIGLSESPAVRATATASNPSSG